MKDDIRVRVTVLYNIGAHLHKEDSFEMEIHDAVEHLMTKYITKGNKWLDVPIRFVTEMSREEKRISEEKEV